MKVTIQETEPTPPPPRTVVIELTYQEAQALRTLLGDIGTGVGPTSQVSNALWSALYNAKIPRLGDGASVFVSTPHLRSGA